MSDQKILIVDDEIEILNLIEIYLVNDGYKVLKACDADNALNILHSNDIQLIILDIMLPGMNGIEFCRHIRRDYNIPIIFLSAKSQDMDKILGLSSGADDYITKPFNPLELLARVKSQLRRYLYLGNQNVITCNNNQHDIRGLFVNKENHTVSIFDRIISLTPKEYEILLLLFDNPGKVFSAEAIFEKVWGEKYYDSSVNSVMVHIWKLREKIEDNPKEPKYIETVWGVGYKIER